MKYLLPALFALFTTAAQAQQTPLQYNTNGCGPGAIVVQEGTAWYCSTSQNVRATDKPITTDLPLVSGNCTIGGSGPNKVTDSGLNCTGSSSGSGFLLRSGVNAVQPTTRLSIGVNFLNAQKDYGAVGDNVTNDGPALANALAACSGSVPLFIPPGIYKTRQKLTVPDRCIVFGEQLFTYLVGDAPSTEIFADNTSGAFTAGGAVLTLGNVAQLRRVAVHGDNIAGHADAIAINGSWVVLDGIGAYSGGTYNVTCPGGAGYQGIQILNGLIGFSAGDGINLQCADSNLLNLYVYSNVGLGIISNAQKVTMNALTVEGNGSFGIAFVQATQNILSASHIVDNFAPGLKLDGTSAINDLSVTGNDFRDNGRSQVSQNDCHVYIAGTVNNANFSGNTYATNTGGPAAALTPNYVFCGSTGSSPTFSGSRITDRLPAQVLGVYNGATIQGAVVPAIPVTPMAFAVPTVAQNNTVYTSPGYTTVLGSPATSSTPVAVATPLNGLRVSVVNTPAAGQTFTYTVYSSTATNGSFSNTGITCQITDATSPPVCADTTHTAILPAGGAWTLEVKTSATSGATGVSTVTLGIGAPAS